MSLLATPPQPALARTRPSTRIDALDWTKGALILLMVIYHAINYSTFSPLAFQLLAFLPLSFLLITGFLVSQVYAAKYDLRTWRPYTRLAIRGSKLFLLFAVLNIAYYIALQHGLFDGTAEFLARSRTIFLSGNDRTAIFEVLLPIAYFLLLAPGLLWLRSRTSSAITICTVAVILVCLGLELSNRPIKNLTLLSVGILGMSLGLISIQTIDRLAQKWIPVLLLYLLYRVLSYHFGEPYAIQMLASVVGILVLYCCALHQKLSDWFHRQMILFGQYSLVAYLLQIALLQIIVRGGGGRPATILGVFGLTLFTAALTYLSVVIIHALRRRSRVMDSLYKIVFA
jgi:hypothetical protein